MSDTLDLTTVSDEPVESNVQVEITDAPEETEGPVDEPEETEGPVEEPVEEEPVEEAPEESVAPEEPVETTGPVEEEPVETAGPVETESPVEEPTEEATEPEESPAAPVEQVAADIRNILTEVPTVSEGNKDNVETVDNSSGLSDDLKQRIAELDYLRECCGNWNEQISNCQLLGLRHVDRGGIEGRENFLNSWEKKSVSVDLDVNYEDKLINLEKLPELIDKWTSRKINFKKNYYKDLNSYTLENNLFKEEQNIEQKVEVLENLIPMLINYANKKISVVDVNKCINEL